MEICTYYESYDGHIYLSHLYIKVLAGGVYPNKSYINKSYINKSTFGATCLLEGLVPSLLAVCTLFDTSSAMLPVSSLSAQNVGVVAVIWILCKQRQ